MSMNKRVYLNLMGLRLEVIVVRLEVIVSIKLNAATVS